MDPIVQNAFDGWIKPETWHTGHALDDNRFFRFVWVAATHSKSSPGEDEIEQMIIHNWKGRLAPEYLKDKARKYASLYVTLSDFAKVRPTR